MEICPTDALNFNGSLEVNHGACTRCDLCFQHCELEALEPVGRSITLKSLLARVLVDKPFFRSTGGGVTLSGGEATLQMDFIHHFLRALQREGVHTALETCGQFAWKPFKEKILPYLDLIYYDLKLMDETLSRRYTGRSNRKILQNFRNLIREAPVPVIPRIPLIPDITATENNLSRIAAWLRELNVDQCALMPYNPSWRGKLNWLGLTSEYERAAFMTREEELACAACFSV